jgi:hypothetical protein
VAVVTDIERDGEPMVGFGFSSIGRFGQSAHSRPPPGSVFDVGTGNQETVSPLGPCAHGWRGVTGPRWSGGRPRISGQEKRAVIDDHMLLVTSPAKVEIEVSATLYPTRLRKSPVGALW